VEGDACSTPALKIEIDRLVEFRHCVLGRFEYHAVAVFRPAKIGAALH
jgi:hypothetical protein